MREMLISVVIPVYNAEKYLKKCIKSLLNQSYKNFELILVNDGSTDLSLSICQEFAKKESRIRVIDKENEGSISTRRRGIEEANGDYIMFVDADDWVHRDILGKLIEEQQKSQSEIVVCNLYKVLNNRAIIKIKNKSKYFDGYKRYENDEVRTKLAEAYLHGHPFPAGLVAKLYTKKILIECGTYLNRINFLGDDLYYNLEMFLKSTKVSVITDPLYYYRIGGNTSRYMSHHFEDIIAGYEIQKDVIQEYYQDSIQNRMNGISIMLLNSFKTTLLNLHRSELSEELIKKKISEYCNSNSIIASLENKGVNNYFDKDFLNAVRYKDSVYLKQIGEDLYQKSQRNNRMKKLIAFIL